jgi:predicted Zn-dependent protease
MRRIAYVVVLTLAAALGGCGTNPVTGERELQFVSEAQEITLGAENYVPSRQMQGGDYVVDPAVTEYVASVGARLAAVSDRNLPYEFVVINSSVPNAWALPGGKIAVNRGLLTELGSEAELAAVLGHEIVHAAARHGAKSMERGLLLQGALGALALGIDDNRYAGLIVGGAQVGAQLVSMKYGRDAELESDRYGMQYMARAGYDPAAAVTLQETFVRLSEGQERGWLDGLFASHPPSEERVERNRATAAELGAGSGDLGRERYLAAIRPLLDTKEGYAAFDEAVKAFNVKDMKQARALVHQAISAEPREARFHALLGDIEASAKRWDKAQRAYDRSIALNREYFQSYLGRGLLNQRRNAIERARADLTRSIELLPTAVAHNALGQIEEKRGNLDAAAEHFRIAASSQSDVGQAAALSLARIELPRNPGAYVQTGVDVDRQGQVIVVVANRSGVPLTGVEIDVGVLDPTGNFLADRRSVAVRETLAPGARTAVATGLGPVTSRAQLQRIRTEVRAARLAN